MKKHLITLVILIQFLVPTGLYAKDKDIYGLWVDAEHREGEKTIVNGKDITNDIDTVVKHRCSLAKEGFGENGKYYYIGEDKSFQGEKVSSMYSFYWIEKDYLSQPIWYGWYNGYSKIKIVNTRSISTTNAKVIDWSFKTHGITCRACDDGEIIIGSTILMLKNSDLLHAITFWEDEDYGSHSEYRRCY